MGYNFKDIKKAYSSLGVKKGQTVLLKTDLRWLGPFEKPGKPEVLKAHFNALADLIDLNEGTLIVPTGSPSLCNTEIPFDPDRTPSEVGILTEFIRTQPGTVRSFHPFISYTAIGKDALKICDGVSRHAYGPETPEARALESDALDLSAGLHPRASASIIHHIEHLMAVPYRYTKEFVHPVVREGKIVTEPFYMYVWYRQCALQRDGNIKIFENFTRAPGRLRQAGLGQGLAYSYSMRDFFKETVSLFKDDIFVWLAAIPSNKPYRQ